MNYDSAYMNRKVNAIRNAKQSQRIAKCSKSRYQRTRSNTQRTEHSTVPTCVCAYRNYELRWIMVAHVREARSAHADCQDANKRFAHVRPYALSQITNAKPLIPNHEYDVNRFFLAAGVNRYSLNRSFLFMNRFFLIMNRI